jgi:hypothetical protein
MKDDSVVIKIRFPRYLHEWIKKKAREEMRSIAQQIAYYVNKELEREKTIQEKGLKEKLPETKERGKP